MYSSGSTSCNSGQFDLDYAVPGTGMRLLECVYKVHPGVFKYTEQLSQNGQKPDKFKYLSKV